MAKALFLDRDGVINEEKRGGYVLKPEEFVFLEGAVEAIVRLSRHFDYVFVVTNQRGIGRALMTERDLHDIHDYFTEAVRSAGGRITKIYFAPAIDDDDDLRKPNTGMALQAKNDFPEIDFERSVMVGNNLSDMLFGRRMAMKTVFLHTTQPELGLPHALIDLQFPSLLDFAASYFPK